MAIKYYETSFDQIEDQSTALGRLAEDQHHNSIDIGLNKKDVKQWIKYIMEKEYETLP